MILLSATQDGLVPHVAQKHVYKNARTMAYARMEFAYALLNMLV